MADSLDQNLSRYLGQNVEALRKSQGYTQSQLAQKAGIPRSTIAYLESGLGNPTLSNLALLSQSLSVSIEELLRRSTLDVQLVKKSEIKPRSRQNGSVQIFNLLPHPIPGLELERFELAPHSHMGGTPHLKGAKEYFSCLQGEIVIFVAGERFEVKAGDVLIFPGDEKHSYVNECSRKLVGLSVVFFP